MKRDIDVAPNGERYEVRCTDGQGRDVLVGFTNRAEGSDLVRRVSLHPVWHSPRVIDREKESR
jgi:hypothetical protein